MNTTPVSPILSTVLQSIQDHAAQRPQAPAIEVPGRAALSYGELVAQIETFVAILQNFGVGRADRVAIMLPDGPEMAVAFLGVSACATAAPLNPLYCAAELDGYFANIQPVALLTQAGLDLPALQTARAHNIPVFELTPCAHAAPGTFTLVGERTRPAAPPDRTGTDDVILLLTTSGTTSLPKLVPLTQRNICTYLHASNALLDLTPEDRGFSFLPMYNIHGLVFCLLSPLLSGGVCLCLSGFDPSRF